MKRKTALYGLLVALAFIFSYIEVLVPIPVGIPGIKLGLANGVTLTALYLLRPADALAVSVLRILLAGLTFGSPMTMLYSLCGGLLSFAVMWLCRRSDRFSVVGVSIAGGVSHNIGQLALAAVVLATPAVAWYAPVLLVTGTVTGALIGLVCRLLLPRLEKLR
ncbi:MAG: Gx transporter family protein [Clostridia bacterium]|nr:Gx transporter family protein [Clostridia bacterium]